MNDRHLLTANIALMHNIVQVITGVYICLALFFKFGFSLAFDR